VSLCLSVAGCLTDFWQSHRLRHWCVFQALQRDQERMLIELQEQQIADAERLARDLDKKEKEEEEALERKMKEEAERIIKETKSKQEAETRARTDLSEEQAQQVWSCLML